MATQESSISLICGYEPGALWPTAARTLMYVPHTHVFAENGLAALQVRPGMVLQSGPPFIFPVRTFSLCI
uniref:Uncharacterized protein n=1 Tax=Neogobius melanostomus TaxID=47308 RepID=A0A8C6T5B6_9GOBI